MANRYYKQKIKDLKEEPPGVHPYTQDLMLSLHEAVIEENRRQSSKKYSLLDERGETFQLDFRRELTGQVYTLIPAGTKVTEANMKWAMDELLASMVDCNFGRWNGSARVRSMDKLREQIRQLGEREGAKENAE